MKYMWLLSGFSAGLFALWYDWNNGIDIKLSGIIGAISIGTLIGPLYWIFTICVLIDQSTFVIKGRKK